MCVCTGAPEGLGTRPWLLYKCKNQILSALSTVIHVVEHNYNCSKLVIFMKFRISGFSVSLFYSISTYCLLAKDILLLLYIHSATCYKVGSELAYLLGDIHIQLYYMYIYAYMLIEKHCHKSGSVLP